MDQAGDDAIGVGRLPVIGRWGRWLIAIVIGSALVRVAWLVVAHRTPVGFGDEQFYMTTAEHIAAGHGFTYPGTQPTALWPPGYPAVLGVAHWFVRLVRLPMGIYATAAVLNVLAGALSVALTGLLASRIAGRRAGLIAAVAIAALPSLVFHTSVVLSEPVFLVAALAAYLVVLWHPWDVAAGEMPSNRRLLVAGVLWGLAVLIRPPFAVSLILLPIALIVRRPGGARGRMIGAVARSAAVLACGAAVVVVPWTVRNAVRMDAFVPISTNTGQNLCIGHNPEARGAFNLSLYCFGELDVLFTPANEVERDQVIMQRGQDWLSSNLGAEPWLIARKTWYTLHDDRGSLIAATSYGEDPWLSQTAFDWFARSADAAWYLLAALAVGGAVLRVRSTDRRYLALVAISAGALIVTWVFFGDPRFKVTMLPLLAVFAGAAVESLWARRRRPGVCSGVAFGGETAGEQ